MTLVVEDGTGLSNADALISLDYFKDYCKKRGYLLDPFDTTTAVEPAIRRGTTFISDALSWDGTRLKGRSQALAFPRINLTDDEGNTVASDEVPSEIERGTAEASWYELNNPNGLQPVFDMAKQIKSKTIGPMSKEFFQAPQNASAAKPVLTIIEDIVGGLLSKGSGSSLVGTRTRS